MTGQKIFRKIQLGQESTAGTAVAATEIWRGLGMPVDQRDQKWVPEDIGHALQADRSYFSKYMGSITLEQIEATYEQLPYLLAGGIEKVVSGAADGAGSGKIYQYDLSDTSANTIQTYTIEGGDNQQAEEMEYAFPTSIRMSGKAGEALMMAADFTGRQWTPTTFTSLATLTTVEEILFQKGKLYIDALSGTLGSTQAANTFLGFDLEVKTGLQPVFTGDGNLYFSFHKLVRPEITCKITFEHDATSVAEKAAWRALTTRQIRMLFEGSTLTTAGTTYSKKTLKIDVAGRWDPFNKIDERDGNDILEATLKGVYSPTADVTGLQIVVVNERASLT